MPRSKCDRCESKDLSNVVVEIEGRAYKLCGRCFSDYLKVDASNNARQIEFIKGKPPDSPLGRLWYRVKRAVRWIMQG